MAEIKRILMAGAGLTGSLLGIFLRNRGYEVEVYEKRPDLRRHGLEQGRSINMALSFRGWKALRKAGLEEKVKKVAIPMYGRQIHGLDGKVNFQSYGKDKQAIWSVGRGGLNILLVNEAERQGVKFNFDVSVEQMNLKKASFNLRDSVTSEVSSTDGDYILGCDGAFSRVRETMRRSGRFNYSQSYIEHGYKELTIPAKENGDYAMDPNALHIWPRGEFMLIALPNTDGSFTCTLFLPFVGEPGFDDLETSSQVDDFFKRTFPDAFEVMPNLQKEFFGNPTSSLVTIQCQPWAVGKAMLVGDAAHAIVPFYGQGMNACFEDCLLLDGLLEQHPHEFEKAIDLFQKDRKGDADAIAELAMDNFLEMRDRVADAKFLLQKRIEALIAKQHPERWTPLYSLVTFSSTSYAEAWKRGIAQEATMKQIMAIEGIEKDWETRDYASLLDQLHHDSQQVAK